MKPTVFHGAGFITQPEVVPPPLYPSQQSSTGAGPAFIPGKITYIRSSLRAAERVNLFVG
jgi:hypothetical protein